jgi:hypothetical protein
MKHFVWILFFLIGCQDYNSNSADKLKYAPIEILDDSLKPIYPIVQNRCFNCHNYHQEWAGYTSNQDWMNARTRRGDMLIDPGNPDDSLFIRRIINFGGPSSDMPIGRGPLPQSEYTALRNWISGLP